jgi:hypothetical protein
MFGAIYKKAFLLAHRLLGEKASGRHYDLIFILTNLVIAFTDGGACVRMRWPSLTRYSPYSPVFPAVCLRSFGILFYASPTWGADSPTRLCTA